MKHVEVPVVQTEAVQTTRQVQIQGSKQVLVPSQEILEVNREAPAQGVTSKHLITLFMKEFIFYLLFFFFL
jgi:hypothetical protein